MVEHVSADDSRSANLNTIGQHHHLAKTDVSVVIPTIGQPGLEAAVLSAIWQTHRPAEVIIVDARPPGERVSLVERLKLKGIDLSHVRVVRKPSADANTGRNTGIAAASGELVALLDDDDVWMPNKLERQLAIWEQLSSEARQVSVLTCQAYVEDANGIYPRRALGRESLGDFLFVRRWRNLRFNGFMQTSSLVVPAGLARRVPWSTHWRVHHDWDWLFRATNAGCNLITAMEPLYVYSSAAASSLSRSVLVHEEIAWGLDVLSLGSTELFGYLTTVVMPRCVAIADWAGAARCIRLAVQYGRLSGASGTMGLGYSALAAMRRASRYADGNRAFVAAHPR